MEEVKEENEEEGEEEEEDLRHAADICWYDGIIQTSSGLLGLIRFQKPLNCTVPYCHVLYCTVLFCFVLSCTV